MLDSPASLGGSSIGLTRVLELDLFSTARGSVTAPAGCGKTQLVADTLKRHAEGKPTLVLTHTNAGKAALEARLSRGGVPKTAYRVSTIDSWAIRMISRFPTRSGHDPSILRLERSTVDYSAVRDAAWRLLSQGDVSDPLRATYGRLVIDEYQDCTISQHNMIGWAAQVLPTYALGDPLQAIFGFREPTVSWEHDVQKLFPHLGNLETPWRWRNGGAERLGRWLLEARSSLLQGGSIDLRDAPGEVTWIQLASNPSAAHQQRMNAARTKPPTREGTVLVIGDSINPRGQQEVASKTPGATTVETVELRDLVSFGRSFDPSKAEALRKLVDFSASMMVNLGASELLRRAESLSRGTARKSATSAESAACAFLAAPSLGAAVAALEAFEDAPNVRVYRPEVLHVCKAAMRLAARGQCALYEAVVHARERHRHLGRAPTRRAVGSTLLLKGLEADVAVVLNPSAMNAQHLYVALTRGAKRLVVCSERPVLTPTRST